MSESILVILADDDSDDRDFFVMAAKDIPFDKEIKVKTLNDGEMLLDFLKNSTEEIPDILFLDINMPKKNGLECLKEIRENESYKNLPVIMFSTSDAASDIDTAKEYGADLFVKKPETIKKLRQIIHDAVLVNWNELDRDKRTFKYLNVR